MSNSRKLRPLLIVVSAPSGGGKSTLCRRLLVERSDIGYSISCTTRAPRGNEVNGREYHFLTEAEFKKKLKNKEFLEHAVVHGNMYGTLRQPVNETLNSGRSVVMDIDVEGARQIREYARKAGAGDSIKAAFVDIFVEPPSMEVLRARLGGRAEDAADEIERRLKVALAEMECREDYKYRIVNDDLDKAFEELKSILDREALPH